ncbi:MAG: hypothetical protein GQ574_06145 [Crocinitomix sp.]|nr:hypothetical protein [Crocinitomix sp.]
MTIQDPIILGISIALAAIFFSIVLFTGFRTSILRESGKKGAPCSLARFQIWLWTLIIPGIAIINWALRPNDPFTLNETCLILLGISVGIGVTSKVIVSSKKASKSNIYAFKDDLQKGSWYNELIMDENGDFSMSRLQNLIFTFVFIAVFIIGFIHQEKLPNFEYQAYVLMGISGGTYLTTKGINRKREDSIQETNKQVDTN